MTGNTPLPIHRSRATEEDDGVSRPPGPLTRLFVPDFAVSVTLDGLRLRREREALAYWVGRSVVVESATSEQAIVTTVIFPRIESGYDYFRLLDGEMARISEWCAKRGVWVLAQIHTHPTDEPHSEADECWPASQRTGFLSMVIPFFGQFSTVANPFWSLHELARDGWREIASAERIEIVPSIWLTGSND